MAKVNINIQNIGKDFIIMEFFQGLVEDLVKIF